MVQKGEDKSRFCFIAMLFFVAFIVISCSDLSDMWHEPVKDYLEEYGSQAMIVSYSFVGTVNFAAGYACVPSTSDFSISYTLNNKHKFPFSKGYNMSLDLPLLDLDSAAKHFSKRADPSCINIRQTSPFTIRVTYPKAFLELVDTGFDISPKITLKHYKTMMPFYDITKVLLKCNTPPPQMQASLYTQQGSHALCFIFPDKYAIGRLHTDIQYLCIDSQKYSASVIKGEVVLQDTSLFEKGLPDDSYTFITGGSLDSKKAMWIRVNPDIADHEIYLIDQAGLKGESLTLHAPEGWQPQWQNDARYTIEYYFQNDKLTGYNIDTNYTQTAFGKVGTTPQYSVKQVEGYIYNEDATVAPAIAQEGNTVVKLYYKKDISPSYNIAYELQGGDNDSRNPQTYTTATLPIALLPATRTGYSFIGWYLESTHDTKITEIATGTTGDITLYALWEEVLDTTEYHIYYELDNGENATDNPSSFTPQSNTIILQDPTREGFKFSGWYTEQTHTTKIDSIPTGTTGDITLYALWEEVLDTTEYHIYYELDNGENATDNPSSFTPQSNTIILQDPTREGFKFSGWYTEQTHTTKIDSIPTGTTGDITLYALWNVQTEFYVQGSNASYTPAIATSSDTNDGTKDSPLASIKQALKIIDKTNDANTTYKIYIDGTITESNIVISPSSSLTLSLEAFAPNATIDSQNKGFALSIKSKVNLTIKDIKFTNGNNAADGGGVCVYGGNSIFENCYISNCKSASCGGGVCLSGGTSTFKNCTINSNTSGASSEGGGVHIESNATGEFIGCNISDNVAEADGGGVYIMEDSIATFTDCSIKNNSSQSASGGGIYIQNGQVQISSGTLEGNKALKGGGLYIEATTPTATIDNGLIVKGNNATSGAGIFIEKGKVNLTSITIGSSTTSEANHATENGGGVCIAGGDVTMTSCDILGNIADASGGGCSIKGATVTLSSCVIDKNNAGGNGGGINMETYTNLTIDSSVVGKDGGGNTATKYGGGVYSNGNSSLDIKGGTVSYNTSSNSGAGLCLYAGKTTVTISQGTNIAENRATSSSASGGGIYMNAGNISIDGSSEQVTIKNNYAKGKGGGMTLATGNSKVDSTLFSGNEAEGFGGGLYTTSNCGIDSFSDNSFVNNKADTGGAIYFTKGFKVQSNDNVGAKNLNVMQNHATTLADGIYLSGAERLRITGDVHIGSKKDSDSVFLAATDSYIAIASGISSSSYINVEPEINKAATLILKAESCTLDTNTFTNFSLVNCPALGLKITDTSNTEAKLDQAFGYSLNGTDIVITGCTQAHIVIPSQINGHKITAIASGAFNANTTLQTITFEEPCYIEKIGADAFNGCTKLESIEIPNSVTEIGNRAFQDCKLISSVVIPNGVQELGTYAFSGCADLKSVTLPNTTTLISQSCFQDCSSLEDINLSDTKATDIERNAFNGCVSLKKIAMPNTVASIGINAFNGCVSLENVSLSSKLTSSSIGQNAFKNCTSLDSSTKAALSALGYSTY